MKTICALLAILFACCNGDDALDAAGDYSVSLTNRENGCLFVNWQEGDTSTNIPVTITQEGEMVTAEVKGVPALFLGLVVGSTRFLGTVSGSRLSLRIHGTIPYYLDACSYTITASFEADLSGDVLTGEIRYTSATNGSPDCGEIEDCVTRQEFNATRPPT